MLRSLLRRVRARFRRARRHFPVIYNANAADEASGSKRALVHYVSVAFTPGPEDRALLAHQNMKLCRQIVALLGERGYVVDVASVGDASFRKKREYDLVISNDALTSVQASAGKRPINVYLATTLHPVIHNRNLLRRHEWLSARRGCRVRTRRVYEESMPFVEGADAVVAIGNEPVASTWRAAFKGPVYRFDNFGFCGTEFRHETKDFAEARKHFLFFASASQIQKGLDLLLEIFPSHPDLHLYICSDFRREDDFCACYAQELYSTPNVHPVGRIRVNSPKFYKLVEQCAYVIHPTCSEGQAGSVVQCMYAGLIPLVTSEAGIDIDGRGSMFPDDSLQELESTIRRVAELPPEWHREHSLSTRRLAEARYSEAASVERWRQILGEILAEDRRVGQPAVPAPGRRLC
jgi:glycosyltransferase involved in cell wall biosynthesis